MFNPNSPGENQPDTPVEVAPRSVTEIIEDLALVRKDMGQIMQLPPTTTPTSEEASKIADEWEKLNHVQQLLIEELDRAKIAEGIIKKEEETM